ncbi:MAG: phospholipid transport system substrate-binding protein [Hyphomicrobiaceae bacterium]|jgi:phospholipid transport system substrate-binding protein
MTCISTMKLRSKFFATLTATAILVSAPLPAAADEAEDMVRNTAAQVLAILNDETTASLAKRDKLEVVMVENADFTTIAKLVLARNWRTLPEADRDEFATLFRRYLTVTYGRNVDNYSNEGIEVVNSREEARGDRTVYTKIVRNGPDDILVSYRVRNFDGRWKIIDVVAEGVSMVSNLRSQFQDIISQGGNAKLLKILRGKVAEEGAEESETGSAANE